jgi:hypothetical protein
MSIYGEGLYRTRDGKLAEGRERTIEQLKAHDWEVRDADGQPLVPEEFAEFCARMTARYAPRPAARSAALIN